MYRRIVRLLLGTLIAVAMTALLLVVTKPARADSIVTTCNETALRAALAGGGVVTFNCPGSANILLSSQIVITSDATMDGSNNGGNPVLIFGNTRLFSVTNNSHLTLNNLTLANGVASDSGGCIYANGAVVLNNVELSQCRAKVGGAVFVDQGGSAQLINSRLVNNTANYFGGGVYSQGAFTITNSYLAYNSVVSSAFGGGIYADGPVRIDGTSFYSNTAANGYGGGIASAGMLSMTNSTLNFNEALNGGGALLNFGTAVLDTVVISSNSAVNNDGGAIYNYGTLNLSNSQLLSNQTTSPYSGGAIVSYGPLNISNSELAFNHAGNGGAIYPRFAAAVTTITDSSFHDNFTTNGTNGWGGALLMWDGAAVTLTQSSVRANTALSAGGGIYVEGSTSRLAIEDSQITGNALSWGLSAGGGIYNEGRLALTHATVDHNAVIYFGGGLVNTSSGVTTLDSSEVRDNLADTAGGIYNVGAMTLNNATISGNKVMALPGGGVVNYGNMIMNNSTVNGNLASQPGGGLYNSGNATLTNSTVSGNTASNGGGFYNSNTGIATLFNVTLANNSATVGGALYMAAGHQTVLTNTILADSPTGGNCFGTITASKFTFSSDNSCALPAGNTIKGQNPNGLDPLLTALGNYGGPTQVHMIKSDSPAKDGVVGSDAPLIDQRGLPRPGPDGSYDIGAVERQPNDSDLAPRIYLPLLLR